MTIHEMEQAERAERERFRKYFYWTGFELRPKCCRECWFMPTNPERDECARMDKQVRDPDMVWNCEGFIPKKGGALSNE